MNAQSSHTLHVTLLALAAGVRAQAHAVGEAKNTIFFLGDDMGPTIVTAIRIYRVGEAECLTMESLKRTARIKTYPNDARTTDSVPSMSVYITGVKMNNEVISVSADTKASDATGKGYVNGADSTCLANDDAPAMTLLKLAKAAGKSVGVVTTTCVMHVTPAITYSHIYHRDGEDQIIVQGTPGNALYNTALRDGLSMLLGGGCRHCLPQSMTGNKCTDTADLTAQLQAANYTYVSAGTQLATISPATTDKLLGLFNLDHMNYELDRMKKSVDEPSLADMIEKATCMLQKNGKDHFLMVEDGRIDHALHGTNAKRTLEDTGTFDEATKCTPGTTDLSNTPVVVTINRDRMMTINGYLRKGNPILGVSNDIKTGQLQLAVDGLSYTTLVFGNGGTTRKATRDNAAAVDMAADDYLQEVGVQPGMSDPEAYGDGDVMLFSSGPGSTSLKDTLDSAKMFGTARVTMDL